MCFLHLPFIKKTSNFDVYIFVGKMLLCIAPVTRQWCIGVRYSCINNQWARLRCDRLLFAREEVFHLSRASVLNYPSFHTGSHPLGFRAADWLLIVSCCTEVVRCGSYGAQSAVNNTFLWFCAGCCACVCRCVYLLPSVNVLIKHHTCFVLFHRKRDSVCVASRYTCVYFLCAEHVRRPKRCHWRFGHFHERNN